MHKFFKEVGKLDGKPAHLTFEEYKNTLEHNPAHASVLMTDEEFQKMMKAIVSLIESCQSKEEAIEMLRYHFIKDE